jgi:hypothetical protein
MRHKIIIRHAPCWQGETFAGLSQHHRKLPNVASEHHFLCLLRSACTATAPPRLLVDAERVTRCT